MDKITSLLEDLKSAQHKLSEALSLPPTEIHKDATIQRFEFTFELSWKLMNAILRENGIEAYGPKNTIREAANLKMIDDVEKWFEFLNARNLTTHVYKKEIAEQVYSSAKEFEKYIKDLIKKISSMFDGSKL